MEDDTMCNYRFLTLDACDGVATITMRREPLNVLHTPMMVEFNAILESVVSRNDFSTIVIRAGGKAFSAGVDIGDHTPDKVGDMIRLFHGIFRKLAATDALTVAVVQGAALGGGCELACFCDIVLACERAKFGQPEVCVGVFPPVAACVLPAQVGIKKALELTALGLTIDAQEAHRIGMVNAVYPENEFESSVERYLENMRQLSRPVMRIAKQATIRSTRKRFLADLEETERLYLDELMKLTDPHEGVVAFLEKRAPVWKHE